MRRRARLRGFGSLLWEAGKGWWNDKAPRLAAALAFYTLLSLAPLLMIVVSAAGLFVGEDVVRAEIENAFRDTVGAQSVDVVNAVMGRNVTSGTSIVGTVTGVAVLIFGASAVFAELQESLNEIWEVSPKPGQALRELVRVRLFSFGLILAVAFLLLVSLLVTAVLSALGGAVSTRVASGAAYWQVVNIVIGYAVTIGIFAAIFKVLPDAKVEWRDVWAGAAVTALLFNVGRVLIGVYLGRTSVSESYGAAGSLVAIIVWVYYSANILFLGAEFTQAYAKKHGSRIVPNGHAVAVPSSAEARKLATERAEAEAPDEQETGRA